MKLQAGLPEGGNTLQVCCLVNRALKKETKSTCKPKTELLHRAALWKAVVRQKTKNNRLQRTVSTNVFKVANEAPEGKGLRRGPTHLH